MDAYSRVRTARQTARPTAYDYISSCFSSFMELHGDRCYGDDRAIIGGIAMLDDMPVTAIGSVIGTHGGPGAIAVAFFGLK